MRDSKSVAWSIFFFDCTISYRFTRFFFWVSFSDISLAKLIEVSAVGDKDKMLTTGDGQPALICYYVYPSIIQGTCKGKAEMAVSRVWLFCW